MPLQTGLLLMWGSLLLGFIGGALWNNSLKNKH